MVDYSKTIGAVLKKCTPKVLEVVILRFRHIVPERLAIHSFRDPHEDMFCATNGVRSAKTVDMSDSAS